jgi:hypothetical protein
MSTTVPTRQLAVDEIMAILPATVPRLSELTARLTPTQLHAPPSPGKWSVNDVLAHLRACQDVLGGNVLRILAEDHPAWKGMSPRTWQRRSGHHDWQYRPALEAFAKQRSEFLSVVEMLPLAAWQRTATVTGMVGDVHEYTAQFYGDWLAGHERAHLKKLAKAIDAVLDNR